MSWFRKSRRTVANDPYALLQQKAGRANERLTTLTRAGRTPSNRLLDRAAEEKRAQAQRFFAAIPATEVGRAFYSGIGMWINPEFGATPVFIYATNPPDFELTRYWLHPNTGRLLPNPILHDDGYIPAQMHWMVQADELVLLGDEEAYQLLDKWAKSAS